MLLVLTTLRTACPIALLAAGLCLALAQSALASACPHPDALGTARVLTIDPAQYPRVGLKSFPQTLPLADKEVVLTFDDGPLPAPTTQVLQALARECARATFFVVGQNAAAHPQLTRRIVSEGHTLAHHTWSHPNLKHLAYDAGLQNIDRGIAAVDQALQGSGYRAAPFFRFPYFESTPALLATLQSRPVAVFGADFWASDWENMTPEQTLARITARLLRERKGIILFHDAQARTATMLPAFLRFMRVNGFRIVHIAPATTLSEKR